VRTLLVLYLLAAVIALAVAWPTPVRVSDDEPAPFVPLERSGPIPLRL
jgi:hypothetical protein